MRDPTTACCNSFSIHTRTHSYQAEPWMRTILFSKFIVDKYQLY